MLANSLKNFFFFLRDLINSRTLIISLTKNDFRTKYLGSYLGLIWAFINPAITITIFWFVFEVGFKSMPVNDFPFILWLITGMIPWFFFADCLSSGTNSVIENSFLVKKVVFRVSMLPIVKLLSALCIHLFFIFVIFSMFALYHYPPDLYSMQVVYYLFATMFLVLGLSWITSSIVVFLKDVGQMIGVVLQFGFWGTPIFWSLNMLPEKYHVFMKLNPVYYLTEGYRDSFINKIWFWEHPGQTLYFWAISSIIFVLGAVLFRRLRPHFADVL